MIMVESRAIEAHTFRCTWLSRSAYQPW